MGFANLSITDLIAGVGGIIDKLNTQLSALAGLFRDQVSGDFTNQVRYSSSAKRLEYWNGTAWAALDLSATAIATATSATSAASLSTSRGNITTNETSTYGNLNLTGNKGAYAGIRAADYGRTFIFNAGAAGIWKDTGAWAWYFDDTGVLQSGTVPVARISGSINAATLGGNAPSFYQPASTAITTSNIASQSVSYATTAGSANAVAWANVSGKPYYLTGVSAGTITDPGPSGLRTTKLVKDVSLVDAGNGTVKLNVTYYYIQPAS